MKTIIHVKSLVAAVICGLALLVPHIDGQEQSAEADDVEVVLDDDSEILRIRISAKNGHVAWSDIVRALMRTGQLDDDALKDKLPSGSLDLTLNSSRFVILGINAALSPDINMRIVPAD